MSSVGIRFIIATTLDSIRLLSALEVYASEWEYRFLHALGVSSPHQALLLIVFEFLQLLAYVLVNGYRRVHFGNYLLLTA